MSSKNKPLGKGLAALLGDWQPALQETNAHTPQISMINIDDIHAGSFQPRKHFDEGSLKELADSIQAQGLLQPITVRPQGDYYEIICGERRWRACQLIAKSPIPVIIQKVSDETALALGLIENLQRENLNPIEEAQALHRLLEEFKLTHQQIAHILGHSRGHVSNQIRLLQLEPEIQSLLNKGQISVGHARCLIGLDTNMQIATAEKIQKMQWSVRMTEKYVQALHQPKPLKQKPIDKSDRHTHLLTQLENQWNTPFEIKTSPKNKGKIIIHYQNEDNLTKLLQHLLEIKEHA